MITFARAGIARIAAIATCMKGMITPTPSPSATARGTDRRVSRHKAGLLRWRAKGRSKRYWSTVSRVGIWRVSQLRRAGRLASAIGSEQPLLLPLPVAFLHRFTLVVHLLAAGKRQLDL